LRATIAKTAIIARAITILRKGDLMKLQHRDKCVLIKYIPDMGASLTEEGDWLKINDRGETSGLFDEKTGKIYIRSSLSLLERECVYLHELSHSECFASKCKCWRNDYWCEYHAMRGELRKVVARDSIRLTRAYLKNMRICVKKYQANRKLWKSHLAAITLLMKTTTFKKLMSRVAYGEKT